MPTETPNHGLHTYNLDDEPWTHSADMEHIEEFLPVRDLEANIGNYTAYAGALFIATDTDNVFSGDGTSWNAVDWGGDGDFTSVDGVATTRANVGAMPLGTYHTTANADGGWGVQFEAEDIHIESVVVDADVETATTLTVELRQFENGSENPTIVDSETVTVNGGPERVTLDFQVPATGAGNADAEDKYLIQRGSEGVPLRRRFEEDGDWSAADYAEQTYTDPPIDFQQGVRNSVGSYEENESWYYFFDWLVGDEADRVTSPFSTDVDEIYMRPRDPAEEFDDISPRALWIDTSGG